MESKKIQKLRKEIDLIDNDIIRALDKRFDVTKTIGEVKKELKLPIEDKQRDKVVLTRTRKATNVKEIQAIFKKILAEAKRTQANKL